MNLKNKLNICYIINKRGDVLLRKKTRRFNRDNWNGLNGKIQEGESLEDSVFRVVEEETGLKLKEIKPMGVIEFAWADNRLINSCYIFVCKKFDGVIEDLGDGELRWFNKHSIPLDKMWDDDKYWLPEVLDGKKVYKRFYFDENSKVIKHKDLSTSLEMTQ